MARTSAFSFKGKQSDVRDIGKALNVETLLEGSVRKSGNRIRITAQLIKIADGYHLWSERFDRELADVFDIQDEISLAVVDQLKVELLGGEKAALKKRPTNDLDVHNLYLLGRHHWYRVTNDDLAKSQQYFEEAIARDPNYAPGYAGLATVYIRACLDLGLLSPKEASPKIRAAADKALLLDPENGAAHWMLASLAALFERDWSLVEYHSKRAIASDPNSGEFHLPYVFLLSAAVRHDEALAAIERAIPVDPVSALAAENAGYHYYLARKFDKALEYCERSLALDPNFDLTHSIIGMIYIKKGMLDEALVELSKAPFYPEFLGYAYGASGRTDEARRILAKLEENQSRGEGSAYGAALVYLGLGESNAALENLEMIIEESPAYLWIAFLKPDPLWDPLRSDPRFKDLLARMNFPE